MDLDIEKSFSRLPSAQSTEDPSGLIANQLGVDFLFYKLNVMFPRALEEADCGCLRPQGLPRAHHDCPILRGI